MNKLYIILSIRCILSHLQALIKQYRIKKTFGCHRGGGGGGGGGGVSNPRLLV